MRTSLKSLMRIAEKVLPPAKIPNMVFTYEGSKKSNATTDTELFQELAELGADAFKNASNIDGKATKLSDIICQIVNSDGKIRTNDKNLKIYV